MTATRAGAALLVAVALFVAAGCGGGGTLGPESLAKQAEAVQSLAAEGALLAGDSAEGRSTRVFREEHSAELAEAAASAATGLKKGEAEPPLGPKLQRLAAIAAHVQTDLEAARQCLDRGAAGDRAPPRGGREGEREARRGARVKLKSVLAVALGILSAIGGFVDIGDIVFNTQAGAIFGYQLLWVVVVGVVGIIVYSEMCGRVSAVSERPVFDLVRERAGFGAGARDPRSRPRSST